MALENLDVDAALFSRPVSWRLTQHMDDLEVEACLESFEFLPESDRFPVLAAVEQDYRPLIAAISERADDTHHWRNTDAAGDQDMHIRRVANGERAVRPIEVDALTHRYRVNGAGEVP